MTLSLKDQDVAGIIFDMDGTMIDNMMVHHRAWQRILAKYGIDLPLVEVKERIHGINEEILKREFGDRFSPAERKQVADEKEAAYREIFKPDLRLIEGLSTFLDHLDELSIPYGIGTAAPGGNADFVLDELDLRPRFKTLVHAGHVTKGKPNPEVFEKAAAGIGVPLEKCIIFEDSPTGAEAAARGAALSVIVTTTHQPNEFAHLDNVLTFINDFRGLRLSFT
ncbi:MAG TPA: HAD-IA family hydrolase [Saprospiraceae bacterium]|nr:HAD-IA family hydrolase [Saprospiraceae bacterium]